MHLPLFFFNVLMYFENTPSNLVILEVSIVVL